MKKEKLKRIKKSLLELRKEYIKECGYQRYTNKERYEMDDYFMLIESIDNIVCYIRFKEKR